jgi:hypothetical protein
MFAYDKQLEEWDEATKSWNSSDWRPNKLPTKSVIDNSDMVAIYDASTSTLKGITRGNFVAGLAVAGGVDAISYKGNGDPTGTEFSYVHNVTGPIQAQINSKEPAIATGTTSQYIRGDKTLAILNTTVVPEGTNLYYADSRARASISASSPILYNSTTGVLSIQVASAVQSGYLSLGDWNVFNNKESAITPGSVGQYWRYDKTWRNLALDVVTSLIGTANQVIVSASVGIVTLSLPQSIATTSTPTFAGGTFTGTTGFADGGTTTPSITFNSNTGVGFAYNAVTRPSVYATAAGAARWAVSQIGTAIQSGGLYGWATGSNPSSTTMDTAFARTAAGAIKATNASTGYSTLDIGSLLVNGTTVIDSSHNAAFSTISVTGQITSTLTNGTAPFVLASQTMVTNLNANFVGGIALAGLVQISRIIATQLPLTGGGDLSADRTLTLGGLNAYGTANQIVGMNNVAGGFEYKTISGTTNRVTVTHAANSVTFSLPQDIHTAAVPTFAGATFNGNVNIVSAALQISTSTVIDSSRNATFNSVFVNAAVANLYLKDTSTGWQSASTTVITPQNNNSIRSTNYTSGIIGWNINAIGDAEFNNVRVRGELASTVFKFSEITATAGTFMVSYSASTVNTDFTTPAIVGNSFTFIAKNSDAGGMLFGIGDIVLFKQFIVGTGVAQSYATITARTNNTSTTTYTATLSSGSVSTTYRAGNSIVDMGVANTGFITLSTDGSVGATPNMTLAIHGGSPWSSITTVARLGNLNGSYGYANNTYGLGIGQYGTAGQSWILAATDAGGVAGVSGIRLGNNTTTFIHLKNDGSGYLANTAISWDTSGNLTVAGNASIAGWTINSTYLAKDTGTNATSAGMSPTDYPFFAGSTYANRATATFRVSTAGILNATGAVISGNITATSGTIAGWTLNSTYINSGTTYIASGFNDPGAGNTVTWFGKSASGYSGAIFRDGTSNSTIAMGIGIVTTKPSLFVSDGTVNRIVIGSLNATWNTGDTAVNDMGMKIWTSGGQKIVEFSSSNNIISSWSIATTYMQSGTTYLASSLDIPAGQVAWFGKQASNSQQGVWLRDATGAQIMMSIGGGNSARFAAGDTSIWRVAIGDMTPAYGTDGVSTGYGMKIWDSAGNKLVEFSNSRNIIAGWTISSTSLSKNEVTIASGVDIANVTANGEGWFGKSASGYYGIFLKGSTAPYLTIAAGNSSVGTSGRPYIGLTDGFRFRIIIGELNSTAWDGVASNSMGMKLWDSAGNKIFEVSDVRQIIAGWSFTSTNFNFDTGTNSTSAGMSPGDYPFYAGATYANRATAPYRVTPAGLLVATNATISGTITGGGGVVTLDSNGLSLAPGASTANIIRWVSGGYNYGTLYTTQGGGATSTYLIGASQTALGSGTSSLQATNNIPKSIYVSATALGTSAGSIGYAAIYTDASYNLRGLVIGSNTMSAWDGTNYTAIQIGNQCGIMAPYSGITGSFDVVHNAYYDGTNWKYMTTASAELYYQTAGTHNFAIIASGTAGSTISWVPCLTIKNTGFLQFNQYTTGNLTTDASGNVISSSDENLKHIGGTFNRSLKDLTKIQPIRYHWRSETGWDTESEYIGFSAQNVRASIPEAVTQDKLGRLSLQDRSIIATLVNAVNELNELRVSDRSELEEMISRSKFAEIINTSGSKDDIVDVRAISYGKFTPMIVAKFRGQDEEIESLKDRIAALESEVAKLRKEQRS